MIVDRTLVERALPGYALGAQVGRGGAGTVLAAKDRLRRDVAIKVLPSAPESGTHPEDEALILTRLEHPHIVRVYDFVPAGELALIVMELLADGDLKAKLRQSRAAPEWACAVVLAVAGALETAHRRGLLHRDVKPANVLFTADGRAKLTDFGIAKDIAGTASVTSSIVGTPRYMAPEQFLGQPLRPTVDVYALAVVAYEMAAGMPLFGGDTDSYLRLRDAHLHTPPPPPPGVPAQVSQALLTALAKDPAHRQQSARAFALDLAEAAAATLGPGWMDRAQTPVDLDDDVRAAARGSSRLAMPAAGLPATPAPATPAPATPAPATPAPAVPAPPMPQLPALRPSVPPRSTPLPPMPSPSPVPPSPFPPVPTGLAPTTPYLPGVGYGTPAHNAANRPAPGGVRQIPPAGFGGYSAGPGYGSQPASGPGGYQGAPPPTPTPPPPPARDNSRRNLIIGGVAIGAVLVVLIVVLVIVARPKDDTGTVVSGASPGATTSASPPPTTAPTTPVKAPPSAPPSTPTAALSLAEQALVAKLDSGSLSGCKPAASQENFTVQAAVTCISTGEKHAVAAFSFFDADSLAQFTKTRDDEVTDSGSCKNGKDHVGRWNYTGETAEQGALICGHENGDFYIYWTYDADLVAFITFDEDGRGLYEWWTDFDALP